MTSTLIVPRTLSPICQMFHTGQTADMRGPVLILIPHFTVKVWFITFFNQWSQTSSLIFKCQIPTYTTKVIWMIYTLPWHIYSLTQNAYTADKTKWNFTGCKHSECLCSTSVFMKRHSVWLSRTSSAMTQRLFNSFPVSEHIQLVIW